MVENKERIDFVYTWVDGLFPGHLDEMQKYATKQIDLNPERWRDTYQILKYSLRSVYKHVDWHGKIYIVTNRPQIPDWLNRDHPNINVVHLDEFMPEQFLPTFSSNAIESFIHKIPGLSEHFVYMCDDFLFYRNTLLDTFWHNQKYTVFNTVFGENFKWRIYNQKNNFYEAALITHGPHFAKKQYWEAMTHLLPNEMEFTRQNKFRDPSNLVTYKLYRRYMLSKKRKESSPILKSQLKKINYFHRVTNILADQKLFLEEIKKVNPKFYCLNDDQQENPDPNVVELIKDFLEENYPDASPYEK